jgi:hypothetical protein
MESNRFASSVVMPWGYKASLVTPAQSTSSYMISLYFSTSFPAAEKGENRETYLKESKKRGSFLAYRRDVSLSF